MLRNCYGFVKVKVMLKGSELCVMLSLGKGMVKIELNQSATSAQAQPCPPRATC